jgi:hypothetical protein
MDQGHRRPVTNCARGSHFVVLGSPFLDLFAGVVQIQEPVRQIVQILCKRAKRAHRRARAGGVYQPQLHAFSIRCLWRQRPRWPAAIPGGRH